LAFKSANKTYQKSVVQHPFDVIIVPGFPYNDTTWHNVVKLRVIWANYLYQNGIAKNIIFSGGAVYSPYIESRIMKEYAKGLGVPANNIYTEEKAEHSTENVYYSYTMARDLGFTKIALATDPFQSSQLKSFIKKYDLAITQLPIVINTFKTFTVTEPVINKSIAYDSNFVSLLQRETFFERFKGTLGKKIIWCEKDLKKNKFRKKYKHRTLNCTAPSLTLIIN
jgi:hypothetical protein